MSLRFDRRHRFPPREFGVMDTLRAANVIGRCAANLRRKTEGHHKLTELLACSSMSYGGAKI
jgi:hypothetical protein